MSEEVWLVLAGAAGPVLIAILTTVANAILSRTQWRRKLEGDLAQARYERTKADADILVQAFDAICTLINEMRALSFDEIEADKELAESTRELLSRAAWRAESMPLSIANGYNEFHNLSAKVIAHYFEKHKGQEFRDSEGLELIDQAQRAAGSLQNKLTDYLARVNAGEWEDKPT